MLRSVAREACSLTITVRTRLADILLRPWASFYVITYIRCSNFKIQGSNNMTRKPPLCPLWELNYLKVSWHMVYTGLRTAVVGILVNTKNSNFALCALKSRIDETPRRRVSPQAHY